MHRLTGHVHDGILKALFTELSNSSFTDGASSFNDDLRNERSGYLTSCAFTLIFLGFFTDRPNAIVIIRRWSRTVTVNPSSCTAAYRTLVPTKPVTSPSP